jgi:site-specific DNA-methyltransferase (adenine-specific)
MAVKKFHISEIIIPERHRKDYGDIESLARSISMYDLYNPIVVTTDMHLNQGGRRLSALRLIERVNNPQEDDDFSDWDETTVTLLQQCKDEDIKAGYLKKNIHLKICKFETRHDELIMELEENLRRKDMTWQEEAMLVKKISEEYQKQHGKANESGKGWGTRDTGQLLGISASKVSQELRLAKAIEEGIIDISASDNRETALKKLLYHQEQELLKILQGRKLEKFSKMETNGSLYNLDAIECAKLLEPNSFGHVITDPPYAIEFDKLTEGKQESNNYIEMSVEDYFPYMEELSVILFDKMQAGYFICFCAFEHYYELAKVISKAGFTVSRIPLVWYKEGSPGKNNHPDKQLTQVTEYAVVAWKGMPELQKQGRKNVFTCANYVDVKTRFHITQKPIELLEEVVRTFTKPGDTVLDLFMGSGSTCKASLNTKRYYIGNDKSDYFPQAKMEIIDLESQLKEPTVVDDDEPPWET